MDFSVRSDPATLESTGFIELVPGQYDGRHWRQGSIFVRDDAFALAEGIILRHYPEYSPYGMNDIPRDTAIRLVSEWRSTAIALPDLEPLEAAVVLGTSAQPGGRTFGALTAQCDEIIEMLDEVASWVEQTCETHDYVAILGL